MCGVVGLLSFAGEVSASTLRRGMHALSHRGPDGDGLWVAPQIALGHTRLAIIDLHNGGQPLSSEDGSIRAVVNGELYDFERIRANLIQRGHTFSTNTDAEILIHLYEEHGAEALQYLRGEFAFLLWDARQQKLLAARDRFGVRPLCYAVAPEGLMFSSEAKALLAMGHRAQWSQEALYQSLGLQYLLPHQTIFEGIKQLPPGCLMEVHDAKWSIRTYWQMSFPLVRDTPPKNSPAALVDALESSIRLRLRADVPVAFQLSGGLDSSLVVAMASRMQAAPLDCFTVRFEEDHYDESRFAREVAEACGARLHLIEVGPQKLADHMERAVAQSEGFSMNSHVSAKYLLSRAIREAGFRVVLTGEGADEVFGGYAHLQQDYADTLSTSDAALRSRHAHILGVHLPLGEGLSTQALNDRLGFVPSFIAAKATLGAKLATLLHQDFSTSLSFFDPSQQIAALIDDDLFSDRHPAHQAMMLWARLGFAGYITKTLGDAMEMAHAVEARLPFVDHRLFEVLREISPDALFQPPKEKLLLRQLGAGILPPSILERTKQPFMAPPIRRDSAWDTFLQDKLRGALPDFIEKRRVHALLERLPSMTQVERQAWDPALMMLLSAMILDSAYFH